MKILVLTHSKFEDSKLLYSNLDAMLKKLDKKVFIVTTNTDYLVKQWCFERMISYRVYYPASESTLDMMKEAAAGVFFYNGKDKWLKKIMDACKSEYKRFKVIRS